MLGLKILCFCSVWFLDFLFLCSDVGKVAKRREKTKPHKLLGLVVSD